MTKAADWDWGVAWVGEKTRSVERLQHVGRRWRGRRRRGARWRGSSSGRYLWFGRVGSGKWKPNRNLKVPDSLFPDSLPLPRVSRQASSGHSGHLRSPNGLTPLAPQRKARDEYSPKSKSIGISTNGAS